MFDDDCDFSCFDCCDCECRVCPTGATAPCIYAKPVISLCL